MPLRSAYSGAGRGSRSGAPLPPGPFAAFAIAVAAVTAMAFFSFQTNETRTQLAERVSHTHEVQKQLALLFSSLQSAETGQRGFLLTGAERYLEPYVQAQPEIKGELNTLRAITADNARQQRALDALEPLAADKLAELAQTIALQRSGDREGTLALVQTDRGKNAMDSIRALTNEMEREEQNLLETRQAQWERAVLVSAWVATGGSSLLLVLIALAAFVASRDYRSRQAQTWVRAGQLGLSAELAGEQRLEVLGDKLMAFLARYLDAQVGAVYVAQQSSFRRVAAYALAAEAMPLLQPGDGLLGQAARDRRSLHVRDVPAGYLAVASATGGGAPGELLVAPAIVDGVVHAVLELGFFRRLLPADLELLDRVSEAMGVAVRAAIDRSRLEDLLEETQRQAEELQTQQEELRVGNEELEQQGRVLRDSQGRLEQQQAELEATNSQLEEQAQQLEGQRDDLTRTQGILAAKAVELERTNRYKSEFLANMSHELRTPLNSTLILSKLLADNRQNNLTEEQVKFAQTISSAGNDLLALINDILDLSRIEAGKIDIQPEPVVVMRAIDELVKTLGPIAQQKRLQFSTVVEPGTPEQIHTDPQRLGQILKNLLSNAFKFTEKGEVVLRVSAGAGDTFSFAVRDSGIGIPPEQQEVIFEAFRQADGSTHRKYGGTGLGLSISRDLARLLGGDVTLQSAAGQGSVFTLTLPRTTVQRAAGEAPVSAAPAAPASAGRPAPLPAAAIDDDRDQLKPSARLILVIEDDTRFAAVLRDLAHQMGFQCVVTHTVTEGLDAALRLRPSAVLLDMNLPDGSGLAVLDQLKRNPQTRHIPVHVASVADYAQQALERGAIGYALKPVNYDDLVEAFRRLEAKIEQGLRRVLVVEDDARQRSAIELLLANGGVEIIAVASAGDALSQLQASTFDCMVMDLNLPDLSGFDLLQKMAELDGVSFPPVIVYTGHDLSRDQELQLNRFARSIIIKNARSPERLLDEVTLFLHQVESQLPPERQRMLQQARNRDTALEGRRVLVVEDDVRNIFALTSVLEPQGVKVQIARNGLEALDALRVSGKAGAIDLVLMDIMMPEMDGLTAMREIRRLPQWQRLPIIALTAKAMRDDQDQCLAAGASDYIAKPLDVEKLLSLVRVWMPK